MQNQKSIILVLPESNLKEVEMNVTGGSCLLGCASLHSHVDLPSVHHDHLYSKHPVSKPWISAPPKQEITNTARSCGDSFFAFLNFTFFTSLVF
jgi:hypothetical protein